MNSPVDRPLPPAEPADQIPDPPSWTKPIGIASLSFAGLSLTCLGCGGVGLLMPILFASGMQQQFPDGLPPQITTPQPLFITSLSVGFVLQLLLVFAGSMLLLRKANARVLHLLYGVLGVLSFAFGAWVSVEHQVAITEWCKANPNTKFAQSQQASGMIGQIVGWTSAILTGLVWPVFSLVFFGVIKKDAREIERGRELVG